MIDVSKLGAQELQEQHQRQKALLDDIRDERAFLGKQTGMHINASEFNRLDQEADKAERVIAALETEIAARKA